MDRLPSNHLYNLRERRGHLHQSRCRSLRFTVAGLSVILRSFHGERCWDKRIGSIGCRTGKSLRSMGQSQNSLTSYLALHHEATISILSFSSMCSAARRMAVKTGSIRVGSGVHILLFSSFSSSLSLLVSTFLLYIYLSIIIIPVFQRYLLLRCIGQHRGASRPDRACGDHVEATLNMSHESSLPL